MNDQAMCELHLVQLSSGPTAKQLLIHLFIHSLCTIVKEFTAFRPWQMKLEGDSTRSTSCYEVSVKIEQKN